MKRVLIVKTPKRDFYYEESDATNFNLKRISQTEALQFLNEVGINELTWFKNKSGNTCFWYGKK